MDFFFGMLIIELGGWGSLLPFLAIVVKNGGISIEVVVFGGA
jgi:hypothetical protein